VSKKIITAALAGAADSVTTIATAATAVSSL
jgi:hypothetical protein